MSIQEILEAHTLEWVADDVGNYECACGFYPDPFNGTDVSIADQHRAHLAEVLEKHMQERILAWQEQAWEACTDAWQEALNQDRFNPEEHLPPNPSRKEPRDGR